MKSKRLLLMLLMALIAPWALHAQTDLTVCTGTVSNQYIPIYGYWADNAQHNQMIFPASELSAMTGKAISKMVFYIDASASNGSNTAASRLGTWTLSLGETTETTLSGLDNSTALTQVYEGYFDCSNGTTATFAFENDYIYNGGNLLVDFTHAAASYNRWYFLGVEATSASVYQYGSNSATTQDFLPQTTFTYSTPATCTKPSGLTVTLTEGNGTEATLAWTENGDATMWEICLNGDEANPIPANTNPYTLTGLTAETVYTAKVRANCGGGDVSNWTDEVTFKPTNAISLTVNNGTVTNGYVPIYGYWCDNITKSQFIIPADDLTAMENGTITKMTFFGTMTGSYSDWGAAKFEVYMAETNETTLSALADYGDLNLVMNAASISIVNGEMVVVFDTPYQYNGGNLMIGFLQTVSGQFSACTWTGVTAATGASMGGYGSTINQQSFLPKIKFAYLAGEAPTCPKPTNLVASNVTGRTVELSWTENGEATAWQICLNGDETNPIPAPTNPFTLTGLTPETPYTVKVRAYCDAEDQSKWSNEVSFTTDVACPTPKITDVTTTPTSAVLTWTGTASEYEMQYATAGGILQYGFEEDLQGWTNLIVNEDGGEWLHSSNNQAGYDYTEVAHTGTGFAMCFSFVDDPDAKFDPGAYNTDAYLVSPMAYQINAGASLNFWYDMANDNYPEYFEVCVATVANPTASDFTAIWTLPTEDEKTGRHEQVRHLDRTRYDNWREVTIDLSDYVGQTIWIAFHDVNEDMYELWLDDVTVNDGNEVTWIPIPGYVTSPYTWEPLDPETSYMVRLRAVCGGEDGVSEWVMTTVTTLSACAAPNALNVPNVTLMPESATLAWTGYQDSYQVRYRTVASETVAPGTFTDDFESGTLDGWTVIRGNEGTEYTDWRIFTGEFSSNTIPPHSGNYVVMGRSWNSSAYHVCNWLITPQVTLDGELSYWVRDDGQYHEHYDVYVSTSTADTTAFTLLYAPGDASGEWTKHTVSLSSYNGQQGYIAFRLQDYDQDWLFIDDVTIGTIVSVPAGEWVYGTANTNSFATEQPLEAETEYEWQVMGLNCNGTNNTEWSEIATFTTPGYCDNPNHIVFDELTATSATISWTGYQDSYNVWYRTAAVEEFFYEDFSNGAAGWAGANMNEDSGTYTLGSGEDAYNAFGFVGDDNAQTLISPTIEGIVSGSTLSFLYYDFSQGATPQTFSVGFASVDEITSTSQFTFGETFTTSTEDYINFYEIEVPEGAKHFAIQCTSGSGSYLFVTYFGVYGPNYQAPGEFVQMVVETNSATLAPLTGETEYEVYVQGICGEGEEDVTYWVGGSFWTPVQTNITQTITLAQGTNWVSFYVNTNLDALKAALETTGLSPIVIKAKNDGQTTYNGARWRGALNTLDFAQMYKIDVPEDCEISLEGMPLDASQITITIKTGDNWIGFPFAQNMTVTEAFASIAINTDAVRSKDGGQATYNGTRWRGALNTLVPGQGYIYRSAVLEDTPFVYPTSSKRNAQNETAVLSSHKMTTRNKSFKAVSSFKALSTSKVNQNPTIK